MRMRTHQTLIVNTGWELHSYLQRLDQGLRQVKDPEVRADKAKRVVLGLRDSHLIGGNLVVKSPVVLGINEQLLQNRRMKFLQGFTLSGRIGDFNYILGSEHKHEEDQLIEGLTVVVDETNSAEFATSDSFDVLKDFVEPDLMYFPLCEIPVSQAELLVQI